MDFLLTVAPLSHGTRRKTASPPLFEQLDRADSMTAASAKPPPAAFVLRQANRLTARRAGLVVSYSVSEHLIGWRTASPSAMVRVATPLALPRPSEYNAPMSVSKWPSNQADTSRTAACPQSDAFRGSPASVPKWPPYDFSRRQRRIMSIPAGARGQLQSAMIV